MSFLKKRKTYVRYRQITLGSNYDAGDFGHTTKVGCYGVYEYVAVDSDGILRF
jgi:hypothetical protein